MPTAAGVIAHRWSRSALMGTTSRNLLAAGVGVVLVGASLVGLPAIVAVMLVCGMGLALGWPRLVGLPSQLGSTIVIGIGVLVALTAVLLTGTLVPLAAVLGSGVVASFIHEMVRRDGRPRLVESVTGTVTGAVAAVSAGGWLVGSMLGPPAVLLTATGAALAVAALAALLPLPRRITGALAVAAGLAAGTAVGFAYPQLGLVVGAAVGAATGLFTASVRVLFDHYPASGRPSASGAIAVLPACALGVPAYAVVLLIGG